MYTGRILEQTKKKYVAFLKDICNIETPSGDADSINKLVDVITDFAENLGLETQRYTFPKSGDFLKITLQGNPMLKPAVFMAHMDTVHQVGSFGEMPVSEDGDFLRGPGVMDCKGGIATGLLAMELMREKENRRPVEFLLTPDEEVSGVFSGEEGFSLIKDTAKNAVAVFNLEPGINTGITVCRRGILKFRVNVTGIAAHAGNGYFEGASAIKEAAHMILEIEGLSRKDGATFNCGVISGGTVVNTVPDRCFFEIDVRVTDYEQIEYCKNQIFAMAQQTVVKGTKREISLISQRPPMEKTEKNLWLLSKWNRAAEVLGIQPFAEITRGGGSDAAYAVIAGAPTLCSCGTVGFDEHTKNERIDLSTMEQRVKLLLNTIDLLEE